MCRQILQAMERTVGTSVMSIWEKLSAATVDLSLAGQIAARLGDARGHHVRDQIQDKAADNALPFTVGMISLGAKMAKSDGVVTKDEVRAFNLAKQGVAGYETCADELITVFRGDRKMLEYVLEGVFHIAKADGVLHPKEEEFLRKVAKRFGFTDAEFDFMKARHTPGPERNPYDVLGLEPSVGNDELRNHYSRLVAENQSDEFLARGMPKEFVLISTERVAAIKRAYNAIAKQRGI